jgi:hypothetical protein
MNNYYYIWENRVSSPNMRGHPLTEIYLSLNRYLLDFNEFIPLWLVISKNSGQVSINKFKILTSEDRNNALSPFSFLTNNISLVCSYSNNFLIALKQSLSTKEWRTEFLSKSNWVINSGFLEIRNSRTIGVLKRINKFSSSTKRENRSLVKIRNQESRKWHVQLDWK